MAKGAVFWTVTSLQREQFLHVVFGAAKEEQRVGKKINHGILEGSHCLVVILC
jgi:hypothetical protein